MFDVSSRAKLSVSALAERKIASARPRKYGLLLRAEEEMLLYGQALARCGMRLGWGRDDGPFFFACPGRKPHERCEPGPILLCMGLFSRFCVWAPRCTAGEALRCVRGTRSLVLRAHGESIQLQCIML